jgi:cytochrome c553
MTPRRFVSILLAVLVVAGLAGVVSYGRASTPVVQPIAFNHKLHVTKAKLDCTTLCHAAATTEIHAGLPSKQVCFECHDPDEKDVKSPGLQRLAGYADSEADLPWQRIVRTAPHVFFSHRQHVNSAKLECIRCHQDVAESSQPSATVSLGPRMDQCTSCHLETKANIDCIACHR